MRYLKKGGELNAKVQAMGEAIQMRERRAVIPVCILLGLLFSVAVFVYGADSMVRPAYFFAPGLVLIQLFQGYLIRKSQEQIGISRLAGRTPKRALRMQIHGALLFLVPCVVALKASAEDSMALLFLLSAWLLAKHFIYAPRRLLNLREALNRNRGKKAETGLIWFASIFWYAHITNLPFFYLAYMVFRSTTIIPGKDPRVVITVMIGIAMLAAMLFLGFTRAVPGWKIMREAARASKQ